MNATKSWTDFAHLAPALSTARQASNQDKQAIKTSKQSRQACNRDKYAIKTSKQSRQACNQDKHAIKTTNTKQHAEMSS
jgi:hypothetical protein